MECTDCGKFEFDESLVTHDLFFNEPLVSMFRSPLFAPLRYLIPGYGSIFRCPSDVDRRFLVGDIRPSHSSVTYYKHYHSLACMRESQQ